MAPAGQVVELAQGDLTEQEVDAIVNAANRRLQHGAGVAGAIVRRGGPAIQQESDAWVRQHGPVSHAEPAYTTAGRLPCKMVIHAVGPVWGEGDEDARLEAAVLGALRRAAELELQSIALPAISTGIFGFPKQRAAEVILGAVRGYFTTQPESGLRLARVVLYDPPTLGAFQAAWDEIFGVEAS
jgi:O-acetyl-ADP-ribose deacetylase (regulator of RNase III)